MFVPCKLHKCTECNKSFSLADILRTHLQTHPGEKPRICIRCEKSFSEATGLRRHIGEGSQVCTIALNATNHSVCLLFWVLTCGLTLEGSHTKYAYSKNTIFLSHEGVKSRWEWAWSTACTREPWSGTEFLWGIEVAASIWTQIWTFFKKSITSLNACAEHNSRFYGGYNWKVDSKLGMEPACKSEVHTVHCTLNWRVQGEYELDWEKQNDHR